MRAVPEFEERKFYPSLMSWFAVISIVILWNLIAFVLLPLVWESYKANWLLLCLSLSPIFHRKVQEIRS